LHWGGERETPNFLDVWRSRWQGEKCKTRKCETKETPPEHRWFKNIRLGKREKGEGIAVTGLLGGRERKGVCTPRIVMGLMGKCEV